MKKLSGYVFDTYDDVDGQVLRSIIENPNHLPPIVKTASRLTPHQLESLPDDRFALILFNGADKMKKYATVDRGNTVLSVLYLLKQAHMMPTELVKTAARNLIGALDHYGIPIPIELEKAAKDGMSPVSGKTQHPYKTKGKVHQLQYPEILEEPKESHENPQLGRHDAAWDDVSTRTNVEGSPGSNFMELPHFPQKEKVKTAGQTFEGPNKTPEASVSLLLNNGALMRQQSWRESPYFDVSGWDPSMPGVPDATLPERTLLEGSYPVDGYDQVKTASVYFDQNWRETSVSEIATPTV